MELFTTSVDFQSTAYSTSNVLKNKNKICLSVCYYTTTPGCVSRHGSKKIKPLSRYMLGRKSMNGKERNLRECLAHKVKFIKSKVVKPVGNLLWIVQRNWFCKLGVGMP